MTSKETTKSEVKFSKIELIASTRYAKHRDILAALLDDKKTYALEEVDKIIEKFMKTKV